MHIILLSGGSGKRLWPLSNETLSKQFLKVQTNEFGESESMVQRVVGQIRAAHPDSSVYVSANSSQEDVLQKQLGKIETILEPTRRNTFPAIVLAAAYLHYVKSLDESETFITCPIDPFAENHYFELFKEVVDLVKSGMAAIGLLGALPTFPTAKYGYILRDENRVTGFKEKPSESEAEDLIADGALWNCSIFALKIGYVLEKARKYVDFDSFESIYDKYGQLPSESFDIEVVEKEPRISAVIYDGAWKDLGTWNTLTEEIKHQSTGKHILISESSRNTHVLKMLEIPIVVNDISDAVVIASHDGILVSSKHGSSYLKPQVDQITLAPMFGEKTWGDFRILEHREADYGTHAVKRMRIEAGKTVGENSHSHNWLVWVVLSGKGILTLFDEDSVATEGDSIEIPPGVGFSLLAATNMELIEVVRDGGA